MNQLTDALPSQNAVQPFWDYLHQQRMNNKLCDIQLLIRAKHPLEDVVEDFAVADCIQAHKLILVASSQFFRRCLEKGDLLSVYNFDGVQSKNMQLLVDYMYHQVPWEDVLANDEASEVARILEIIQHEESMSMMDYPKDVDGNRVLVIKRLDRFSAPGNLRTRSKRVIVDDLPAELQKHNIVRGRKKVTNWEDQVGSPLVVTQMEQAMGMSIVAMETMPQVQAQTTEVQTIVSETVEPVLDNMVEVHGVPEQLITEEDHRSYVEIVPLSTDVETPMLVNTDVSAHAPTSSDVSAHIPVSSDVSAHILVSSNGSAHIPVSTSVDSNVTVHSDQIICQDEGLSKAIPEQEMSEAQSNKITDAVKSQEAGSSIMKYILQGSSARRVESKESTIITVTKVDKSSKFSPADISKNRYPSGHQVEVAYSTASIETSNIDSKDSEENSKYNSPQINLPKEVLQVIRPDTRNISSAKQTLEVLTPRGNTISTVTTPVSENALEQSMPRYSTRFRGQKRVVQIMTPQAKKKKVDSEIVESIDSPLCEVSKEAHVEGKNCEEQVDGGIPSIKIIKLEKSQFFGEDVEKNKSDKPNVHAGASPVSALPSIPERKVNLAWNKSQAGELRQTSAIQTMPAVSPLPITVPRRRGRPRKVTSEQQQAEIKINVLKQNEQAEDSDASKVCSFCSKQFKNNTGLSIHMQWKHGMSDAVGQKKIVSSETFTCEYCNKVCGCFQALVQHMRCIHNKVPTHKCEACNIDFTTKRAYNTHMVRMHNSSLYKCELCDTTFKSAEGYKIHIFKKHTEAEKTFKCPKCAKMFKMKHELAIHLKITHAERNFKCKLCPRAFKGRAALKRHLETYHTNIRTVQCTVCSMLFKTKQDMLIHERKHFLGTMNISKADSKSNEHKCTKCGKIFNKPSVLQTHLQQVHHAKEAGVSYMCTMCDKSYFTKNYLLNHIRQMHLPRRYKCAQCLYEFPHQYMLKKHMTKCKGFPIILKPFRCMRCNRYFNLKGNLTRHIRTPGRCRRMVRNYADYIVVVKSKDGDKMMMERVQDEEDTPEVTLEALQASEALQQLQASGSMQHYDQDMIQMEVQDDSSEVILDPNDHQVKQQVNAGILQDQVIGMEDLKNLISLPDGLQPMNIKKDSDGNVIIEVSGQEGNSTVQDYHLVMKNYDSIQIPQGSMEGDIQIVGQGENMNHQFIRSSTGEYILQTITGLEGNAQTENTEVQVESIEMTSPAYGTNSHQDVYQIGPDGTLQHLVPSEVQDGNIQIIEDGNIQVVHTDGSVHMIQDEDGVVQVVEDPPRVTNQFTVKEEY